ncbi:ATP-binding cassette [Spiroplasma sp. TIUS-1]|uniref:ABC transporter ATP-binding protein n=1 Tax=Spiroplasma sp. TIUS-1 TaxID=216963 RepID=UPI00139840C0|nr:ABC transporter ATP-binding protein [Spiroplasma sp. TIUS-1]QHX35839.1 ATP-binding cassette [Spiroplasma sp. TIUS-1]
MSSQTEYTKILDPVDKPESDGNSETYIKIDESNMKATKKIIGREATFVGTIFATMKKNPGLAIGMLVFVTLGSICGILAPLIIQQVTLDLKGTQTYLFGQEMIWWSWGILQLCLFIGLAFFTYMTQIIAGKIGRQVEINLRNAALKRLFTQDISYYSDKKIGETLTKLISDTQIVGEQAQIVPVAAINAVITFFGSLVIFFILDVYLATVVIVTIVGSLGLMLISLTIIHPLMIKMRSKLTKINGDVTDRVNSIRLIKSAGSEDYKMERFWESHKIYYKFTNNISLMVATFITILVAATSSMQVIVVIAAAILYHGEPALEDLLPSFIAGIGIMTGPIMQVAKIMFGFVQAEVSSYRIQVIIKSSARIDPHYNTAKGYTIEDLNGDIVFDNVEFTYPEKPDSVIIPKFDFTFEKGKSYAFVGETGSGKSTIAKMLLRFYDPSKGRVLINNNVDLKDVRLSSYLKFVGYVEQEPQIILGTVFDNIKYGNFGRSDEDAIKAAKKAELHNIIMSFSDGYNTVLGERGFMLSGGQKQRLVIARMFLKDPQLLILDEATSALDNIVEKEIQENLENLMKGRTSVTIAHRLSTIKNVDQIVVLGRGTGIVQVGTFDELKDIPGHFQNLYKAGQSK